ncbi:LacI family DNA-binding transcriptional regulator [Desertivirga xinjiangensis]|uniref:LacI family DNA-binding transcriptional regulator n=1 Tax=Desertivirga xinjiangensis TaxID=539206 RepID=UPI002109ED79|nr:LacI family DNA-binding transcriptional regulator [Pedobacter xinjiangensis]
MKPKEVTIYDIAERLNIAASTVSRGLKGHSSVSLETQKKIAAIAEEMGYRSNNFAANLRTKTTNTIGVILPRLNSSFVANVIAGIEKVCNNKGYNLIITQSLESREKEIRNVKTMFSNRVDGLLVSLSEDTKDISHFDLFFKKNIPVLFFDRVPNDKSVASVFINNEEAGYLVTKHLISTGAKRIAHISGNQEINVYEDRFRGYLRALKEFNLSFDERYLIITDLGEETGRETAKAIVNMKADGVFAANDTSAATCMNELKRLGYTVPDDILVAGFNNDVISRNVSPPLTTVDNPGMLIGEIAAKSMVDHLENQMNLHITSGIILKSELIVRESTGNIPQIEEQKYADEQSRLKD